MRNFLALFLLILTSNATLAVAQKLEPVIWETSAENDPDGSVTINLTAKIEKGWHLYGLSLPEDGPNATSVTFNLPEGASLTGELTASVPPSEKFDAIFSLKLMCWESDVILSQRITLPQRRSYELSGTICYQACNGLTCTPPKRQPFSITAGIASPIDESFVSESKGKSEPTSNTSASNRRHKTDWWSPVDMSDFSQPSSPGPGLSPWIIFLWGIAAGLIAMLTPCVWPMIPLTVDFFLNNSSRRRWAVVNAIVYGAAILIIYLTLGIAITAIYGVSEIYELSTAIWINPLIALLLLLFAISFLGGFKISLPSKWSRNVDRKAENSSGIASTFLMALTLAIVSFPSTCPIIGTLLIEAASTDSLIGPEIAMTGFATALALPFTLFALFPALLKEMPPATAHLNSVKVVIGFIELGLALSFFAVADKAYGWHLLDRMVFIAIWIAISLILTLYLLGKFRFAKDSNRNHIGTARCLLAIASLSFALYLLPGLWGEPLNAVNPLLPPGDTQKFSVSDSNNADIFTDFDQAMQMAENEQKPILLTFSEFGDARCRQMQHMIFDNAEVCQAINNRFIFVKLMADDHTKLTSVFPVKTNDKGQTLETAGEKWRYLQEHKFNSDERPYTIILDNSGNALISPMLKCRKPNEFMEWLDNGFNKYHQER